MKPAVRLQRNRSIVWAGGQTMGCCCCSVFSCQLKSSTLERLDGFCEWDGFCCSCSISCGSFSHTLLPCSQCWIFLFS